MAIVTIKNKFNLRKGFLDLCVNIISKTIPIWGYARDPKWKQRDSVGHFHQWRKGKITNAWLDVWSERDEDGEEIGCSRWICNKCGEIVVPGTRMELCVLNQGQEINGSFLSWRKFKYPEHKININEVAKNLSGKMYITEIESTLNSNIIKYHFVGTEIKVK